MQDLGKFVVLVGILLVGTTARAGQWDSTITVDQPVVVHAEDLTGDTMVVVDATQGFGGLYLPDPAVLGIKYVAIHKADNTSNPVRVYAPPGGNISGFSFLSVKLLGNTLVVGCDGTRYFVASRSTAIKQLFEAHRTVVVSQGQSPYRSKESDRHAMVRVHADTGPGEVFLDVPGNYVLAPGYRNTYTISVQRTRGSTYPVFIYPGPGTSLDGGQSAAVLTGDGETVVIDFDSQVFEIITRHAE